MPKLYADAATKAAKHKSNMQQCMRDALQQSLHHVTMCTSQLQSLGRQQHAMQAILQTMITKMQDSIALLQEQ